MTAVNDFPMPFLISAEEFARRAVQAILRRDRYRTIPWQMGLASALLRSLPRPLYDRVFEKAPRKPRPDAVASEPGGAASPHEGGASW
jgi:short-subunit dehydrogenase